jgi:hypothetical protein
VLTAGLHHACPPDPSCRFCKGTAGPDDFDWSFAGAVYCISLRHRDDRAESAAAEFHRVGLCRQVIFYRPEKHEGSAVAGIWNSHRHVVRRAAKQGHRRVLVFEDDVLISRRLRPETLRRIAAAIEGLPADWTLFFLGHWPLWAYPVGSRLLRVGSACAHAYVGSPRLMDWFESTSSRKSLGYARLAGKGVDAAYAALPGAYAWFPMIAIQSASRSDHISWEAGRERRKVKHLITYSRHRERLLSRLMPVSQYLALAMAPLAWLRHGRERPGRAGMPE